MADDGIFSQDELQADALKPNEEAPPIDQGQDDRPRDEQGRFAPRQDAPAPQPDEQRDERGNVVPQGALHAERERRKAAEKELSTAREQLTAIQRMREQVQNRQPAPDAPEPPKADDPASQIAYLTARLEEVRGAQSQFQRQQHEATLDQAEHQHLAAALTTSEADFRAQKPDYDDAVNHVITARAEELKLYGLNPVQIQQALRDEVLDVTRSAIQQGRSPAEVAYQLATLRGYRPKEGGQEGQPANPAAVTLAAIQQARNGSRSLGQASGAAPPKDLNAQTIAAMNDDEFEALYSTPEGRAMIDRL